jgi:hypothetical protein
LAQLDPLSQTKVHPPPAHEAWQVEPARHVRVQPPPAQLDEHVAPDSQVTEQWPVEHVGEQLVAHSQPVESPAPQAGSVPPELDPEPLPLPDPLPPLGGTQLLCTSGSSSPCWHDDASPLSTAALHVCCRFGVVQ